MSIGKSRLIRIALPLISLVFIISFVRSIITQLSRSDVVGERQEALLTEKKRNQQLKERLKEATSPAFIEKQAREKLGLAHEGDTIILMQSPSPQPQDSRQGENLSHWQRWWQLFF